MYSRSALSSEYIRPAGSGGSSMLCCSLPCGRREWRVLRHNWASLIMGSHGLWEVSPFFSPQWQSLCTALMQACHEGCARRMWKSLSVTHFTKNLWAHNPNLVRTHAAFTWKMIITSGNVSAINWLVEFWRLGFYMGFGGVVLKMIVKWSM